MGSQWELVDVFAGEGNGISIVARVGVEAGQGTDIDLLGLGFNLQPNVESEGTRRSGNAGGLSQRRRIRARRRRSRTGR